MPMEFIFLGSLYRLIKITLKNLFFRQILDYIFQARKDQAFVHITE